MCIRDRAFLRSSRSSLLVTETESVFSVGHMLSQRSCFSSESHMPCRACGNLTQAVDIGKFCCIGSDTTDFQKHVCLQRTFSVLALHASWFRNCKHSSTPTWVVHFVRRCRCHCYKIIVIVVSAIRSLAWTSTESYTWTSFGFVLHSCFVAFVVAPCHRFFRVYVYTCGSLHSTWWGRKVIVARVPVAFSRNEAWSSCSVLRQCPHIYDFTN